MRAALIAAGMALLIFAVVLLWWPWPGGDAVVAEEEFVFVPDTSAWVGVVRGDWSMLLGKLDAAGNFIPDLRYGLLYANRPQSSVPPYVIINSRGIDNEPVYEYRSGRLIKGTLDKDHNSVPDVESKVIDFKDFRYSKDAPRIYNLPGRFVKKGNNEPKKE